MHKPVQTDLAPAAIGPYSQAIVNGDLVYTSGQIPLDPKTGELVVGTIQAETTRVLENLGAVLEAAGAGFDSVLKTTIFLTDMGDFQAVNDIYAARFTGQKPARLAAAEDTEILEICIPPLQHAALPPAEALREAA